MRYTLRKNSPLRIIYQLTICNLNIVNDDMFYRNLNNLVILVIFKTLSHYNYVSLSHDMVKIVLNNYILHGNDGYKGVPSSAVVWVLDR